MRCYKLRLTGCELREIDFLTRATAALRTRFKILIVDSAEVEIQRTRTLESTIILFIIEDSPSSKKITLRCISSELCFIQ